jgi:periplasmic protein TonB
VLSQSRVLTVAGAIAIHVLALTTADVLLVTHPPQQRTPAPHVELVDVEVPKRPPPPPPPPPVRKDMPVVREEPAARVRPTARAQTRIPEPTTPPTPVPPTPTSAAPGGDPGPLLDHFDSSVSGDELVAKGKRTGGGVGQGGSGGGTGSGTGTGTGGGAPVSVATIKTPAKVRGDYGYFSLGKDYPAEAKQLGIEGAIKVRLVVDTNGKVTAAVLLNRLGHGLDEIALTRARAIEFEPARDTNDQPVSSIVVWTFHMELPK